MMPFLSKFITLNSLLKFSRLYLALCHAGAAVMGRRRQLILQPHFSDKERRTRAEVISDLYVLMYELLQSITIINQVSHQGFDGSAHLEATDWNQLMIQQMLAQIFCLMKAYVVCM